MTTQIRKLYVNSVETEPERILRNSRATTADSSPINEIDFLTHFTRISRVDDLWSDNLNILPEKAVRNHVENKNRGEGIKNEKAMT